MTKGVKKDLTFLPVREQKKLHKEIEQLCTFFPGLDDDRPQFEDDLRWWLDGETWTHLIGSGVFQRKRFISWANQTISRVREDFLNLYQDYDIPPSAILSLLGYFKIDSLTVEDVKSGQWILPNFSSPLSRWFFSCEILGTKLRSKRKAQKDVKTLRKAAQIIDQWEYLMRIRTDSFQNTYPYGFEIREVARNILQLTVTKAHRPEAAKIKRYAKALSDFFEIRANKPLYAYVGRLLKAAFNDMWNPAGDLRDAAKKLVKAPLSSTDIPTISPLSLCYPSPLGSIREGLKDAIRMCVLRGRLTVRVEYPPVHRGGSNRQSQGTSQV
ncbi:MAG: hypothetical protein HY694_15635 [Deltaproteobacteria bacterium]|nr:hypothetical protein [Deltaproteobacteria bacterium]